MRRGGWIGLAVWIAALVVAPPAGVAASARAGDERADARAPTQGSYETRLLELVNYERSRRGLRPLRPRACADAYAARWSSYLARNEVFRHQSLAPMLRSCGARQVGENIGNGSVSADAMMKVWMASAMHRANILNPRFSYVGLGATRSSSGRWYAVQDFVGF